MDQQIVGKATKAPRPSGWRNAAWMEFAKSFLWSVAILLAVALVVMIVLTILKYVMPLH